MAYQDFFTDDPFRPLVSGWIGKLDEAKRHKEPWQQVADECMRFFSASAGWMWEDKYRTLTLGKDVPSPRFRVTIAKAFELVALFGPVLFWRYPIRHVLPIKPMQMPPAMMGDPNDPFVQQAMHFEQMRYGQELATKEAIAELRSKWLNYTPGEMPNGGLKSHGQLATTDALVKGRGISVVRPYQFPGSQKVLTGGFYHSVDKFFIDPDATSPDLSDAQWMALEHNEPYWEVERRFGLPSGSMKKYGSSESGYSQGERKGTDTEKYDRQIGKTFDLVCWYEIWSKGGVGARLTGMKAEIKDFLDQSTSDYAYVAVCKECPYPLNAPTERLKEASPEDVQAMFDWPIPFWRDDRWPISCHDPETEVLTDDGWKLFSELSGDESLATVNLQTDTTEFQKPTRLIRKRHVGDMIRFSGRQKLDMLVTPDHRMVAYAAHGDVPQIKTAADVLRSDQLKLVAKNWVGKMPELPEFLKDVDIESFAEWLGFYIAEGSCTIRRLKSKATATSWSTWRVNVSQKKPVGVSYYEALSRKLPFTQYRERGGFSQTNKRLGAYLSPLGKAHDKYVPQWVKDAPQHVIRAFLRGYMMGDGTHSPTTGQRLSFTVSKRLADDIQELWLKVGVAASIRWRKDSPNNRGPDGRQIRCTNGGIWVVSIHKRTRAALKNPKSESYLLYQRESGYDDMVYCATVPNGTLITRRNGKVVVSGNCLDFYRKPGSVWPIAPMMPGLGELKFLNVMVSHLCNRIVSTCRDFIGAPKAFAEEIEKAVSKGLDLSVIPIPGGVDPSLDMRKLMQIFQFPPVNSDVWTIIEKVSELFDKRVGLSELLYGLNPGAASRSAEDAAMKRASLSVRPDWMANCVEEWQSEIARMEDLCAVFFLMPQDVLGPLGQVGAQLWQQLIMSRDIEDVLRGTDVTIEAGSARKPNKDRDIANWTLAMPTLFPLYQQYAMTTGNSEPLNWALQQWAQVNDLDIDGGMLGPFMPPMPPPMPPMEGQPVA